jgi:chemotaxis-related protein WspD
VSQPAQASGIVTEPASGIRKPSDSVSGSPADPSATPCWHQIGVYGDGTCPQLAGFIHCRNCPVYSSAGLQLLEQALLPDYRCQWTAHFAQEKSQAAPAKRSAVVFLVGKEWLALPTQVFQEVAERRRIHSLPHRRQGVVLGLANVRGELLICISLERLLGLQDASKPEARAPHSALPAAPEQRGGGRTHHPQDPLTYPPATHTPASALHAALRTPHSHGRLLVVNVNGQRFAFPVDDVQGIHRFEPEHLRAPPATVAQASPNFTQGVFRWQDRSIGLLDPAALLATFNRSLT